MGHSVPAESAWLNSDIRRRICRFADDPTLAKLARTGSTTFDDAVLHLWGNWHDENVMRKRKADVEGSVSVISGQNRPWCCTVQHSH